MILSVVIPCYNMEKYLPSCLNSLLDQDIDSKDLQIIVVNDGSTDRTLGVAKSYADAHSSILVIDKKNAGVGAARNSGLDRAKGKYTYFLDPDDYVAQNSLGTVLKLMDTHNLEILSFDTTKVNGDNFRVNIPIQVEEPIPVKDGISYLADKKYQNEIWWFVSNTQFLRRTNIRFIEGKWMEDAIFTAQLFSVSKRMAHINLNIHRYRILPNSAMRNKTPEHYNKVIFDNANAAEVFESLIASINDTHPNGYECKKRLKTRQQSFVFFLLVRLMKSDLALTEIKPLLQKFETIGAYPLDQFLGKDYKGIDYSVLVFVFNRKKLIVPFMRLFRILTLNMN